MFAPADQFDQFIDVLLIYFAHDEASKQRERLRNLRRILTAPLQLQNGNVPETQRRSHKSLNGLNSGRRESRFDGVHAAGDLLDQLPGAWRPDSA
jgi:hypothetical protein